MSFTKAIVEIVRDNGNELTTVEIRDHLRRGYPRYYGTPSHVRNVEKNHYPSIDVAVIAQIDSSTAQSKLLGTDSSVRPKVVYYKGVSMDGDGSAEVIEEPHPANPEIPEGDEEGTARDEGLPDRFTLRWHLCNTYDEAKDFFRIVYLHERDDKPYYIGIARNSFFGGNKRSIGENHASGRYNSGYRHWIEGCLLSRGTRLYIAEIVSGDSDRLAEVENYLIKQINPVANRRRLEVLHDLEIAHTGRIPASLLGR